MREPSCPLSKRLRAAADFVPKGSIVADIGTDHAYLPVYLVQNQISPKVYACDIKEGPLQRAKETIERYHCQGSVCPLLSNGLFALSPEMVDTIIVAGMGGDTIFQILSQYAWCREKNLIVQPMTAVHKLRRMLYSAGFGIEREVPVEDGGALYTVMKIKYTGLPREITEVFARVGKVPEECTDAARKYIALQASRVMKKAVGLKKAGDFETSDMLLRLAQHIREIGEEMECEDADQAEREAGAGGKAMGKLVPIPSSATVSSRDIACAIDQFAPYSLAEPWDNSGFLVGDADAPVNRVLLALDVTLPVLEEAETVGAQLILTHHPVLFHAVKELRSDNMAWQLARRNLSALCAHTNLDAAPDGVNDVLAGLLELDGVEDFLKGERGALGRVGSAGKAAAMTGEAYAALVKEKLGSACCLCALSERPVRRVAVVSGAGGSFVREAKEAGADLLVTGEAKHSEFLLARQLGISLVAAGHYETEAPVLFQLKELLAPRFPGVEFLRAEAERSPVAAL